MATLKLTSDTLAVTPAGGEIEYNGQFFGADSNNSRAQFQRLALATSQTASGTSVDFTGIPAWVKRITVMFNGVSTNGTSNLQIQIGAGSVTTSGYTSNASYGNTAVNSTAGFIFAAGISATSLQQGHIIITLLGSNTWVQSGVVSQNGQYSTIGGGSIALSGTLDRVRITTANGTDTFDAGSINILYEG